MSISEYDGRVARASTTADVFNAVAEFRRREILDLLAAGEKPVGAVVEALTMAQPQVSKHLRVLSEVGLVTCRTVGRRRLYRVDASGLKCVHDWVSGYEGLWNERLDRLDDYVTELQREKGEAT